MATFDEWLSSVGYWAPGGGSAIHDVDGAYVGERSEIEPQYTASQGTPAGFFDASEALTNENLSETSVYQDLDGNTQRAKTKDGVSYLETAGPDALRAANPVYGRVLDQIQGTENLIQDPDGKWYMSDEAQRQFSEAAGINKQSGISGEGGPFQAFSQTIGLAMGLSGAINAIGGFGNPSLFGELGAHHAQAMAGEAVGSTVASAGGTAAPSFSTPSAESPPLYEGAYTPAPNLAPSPVNQALGLTDPLASGAYTPAPTAAIGNPINLFSSSTTSVPSTGELNRANAEDAARDIEGSSQGPNDANLEDAARDIEGSSQGPGADPSQLEAAKAPGLVERFMQIAKDNPVTTSLAAGSLISGVLGGTPAEQERAPPPASTTAPDAYASFGLNVRPRAGAVLTDRQGNPVFKPGARLVFNRLGRA